MLIMVIVALDAEEILLLENQEVKVYTTKLVVVARQKLITEEKKPMNQNNIFFIDPTGKA